MADSATSPDSEPDLKIGSYRLIERLGTGGMSSVLRAVHVESGHEVAVKVLPRYLAKNPILLQRFLREAKSAESLEHPNIVAIYDRGFDQGRYYLVLEYIAGGDLHDRVKNRGPLDPTEALGIVRAAAEGLRYAAGRGVIHRDVKPANLLLTLEGQLKITDLGLALQIEEEDERVTRDGTTVGTVDYMAPEQARDSRATSVRSDIYSLGCTLYYLLTGTPPFPGGDVIDKLRRHIAEPPPDVRMTRPDVPAPVAELILKMMAKRPERRFADYGPLIAAIDAIPRSEAVQGGEPLFALIDDEEPPETMPLYALIDDDDNDVKALQRPMRPSDSRPPALDLGDLNLAELEPISGDMSPASRPPQEGGGSPPTRGVKGPKKHLIVFDEPDQEVKKMSSGVGKALQVFHDSADHVPKAQAKPSTSVNLSPQLPVRGASTARPWILGLAIAVTAAVLFGVASALLRSFGTGGAGEEAEVVDETEPGLQARAPNTTKSRAPSQKGIAAGTPVTSPPAPSSRDGARMDPREFPEVSYPRDVESRFLPDWAMSPIPDKVDGPFVTVRRAIEVLDNSHVATLWRAFEKLGGTIEIADDGPFFEDDFRIAGKDRLIRARPGFRPVVKVQPPTVEFVRAQPAVIVLERSRLILDGLDLVVNVPDLPRNQTALFLCRGSELGLNNCTVTVINPNAVPFALVQTDDASGAATGGRPSRVLLERTLVRSQAMTTFDLMGGSAEVVVSRSVCIGGKGPFVSASGGPRAEPPGSRQVHLVRSLIAGRGPIVQLAGAAAADGKPRLSVRSLGTTFTRIKGDESASLIAVLDDSSGSPHEIIDWLGASNAFSGWPAWLSSGAGRSPAVADLAAAKQIWPGTDAESQEMPSVWAEWQGLAWLVAADIGELAPERMATLARVASPRPFLAEKTVGAFERLPLPAEPPPAAAPGGIDLHFDAQDPTWRGDLGAFLQDRLKAGAGRVRVRASGSGNYPMTPVRLPEAVSLELLVEQPANARGEPLSWTAREGATTEALIEAQGSDLTLIGVRLRRDKDSGPKHLILVEDGHLTLGHSILRTATPGADGDSLIAYRASGRSPTDRMADRPIFLRDSVLLAAGNAVIADMGQGVVALANCAIAAGKDALVLRPQDVPADRFKADLWLDHCTLAAASSFVRLGPRPGEKPGPDRPWLVSSRNSAFLSAFARSMEKESVLLRVDAEAMAHDVLFWQGQNDAVDVANFTASGDAPPLANRRPEVQHLWIDLWGHNHMLNVTGPTTSGPKASVRLLVDQLRPGQVDPGDMTLKADYHPGRSILDVGADLRQMNGPAPHGQPATDLRGRKPSELSSTGAADLR